MNKVGRSTLNVCHTISVGLGTSLSRAQAFISLCFLTVRASGQPSLAPAYTPFQLPPCPLQHDRRMPLELQISINPCFLELLLMSVAYGINKKSEDALASIKAKQPSHLQPPAPAYMTTHSSLTAQSNFIQCNLGKKILSFLEHLLEKIQYHVVNGLLRSKYWFKISALQSKCKKKNAENVRQ